MTDRPRPLTDARLVRLEERLQTACALIDNVADELRHVAGRDRDRLLGAAGQVQRVAGRLAAADDHEHPECTACQRM